SGALGCGACGAVAAGATADEPEADDLGWGLSAAIMARTRSPHETGQAGPRPLHGGGHGRAAAMGAGAAVGSAGDGGGRDRCLAGRAVPTGTGHGRSRRQGSGGGSVGDPQGRWGAGAATAPRIGGRARGLVVSRESGVVSRDRAAAILTTHDFRL